LPELNDSWWNMDVCIEDQIVIGDRYLILEEFLYQMIVILDLECLSIIFLIIKKKSIKKNSTSLRMFIEKD
jgi:hypothetical protein